MRWFVGRWVTHGEQQPRAIMQRFGGWVVVERAQSAKTVGNHSRLRTANSNLQRSIGVATEITKADGTPLIAKKDWRSWNTGVHLASYRSRSEEHTSELQSLRHL